MTGIAFIGLGHMGGGMAANLAKAGHDVRAFDLSAAAIETAKSNGCLPVASAAEAVADAQVVVTMLPAGKHVAQVYEETILKTAKPGTLLIDSSTIDVATARQVAEAAQAKGLVAVDAPVSGGIAAAAGGTLTFMVGGSAEGFERARPILEIMGKAVIHAGEIGSGQAAKVCNNMILVAPDTSPRGEGVANDDAYDMGQGAGFYVDATRSPWTPHFRMRSYIEDELPALVAVNFPIDMGAQGITGHSMGGHGALTVALRNPDRFKSVSAFAPIVAPSQVPWGQKALGGYLGDDPAAWRAHDAVALIEDGARVADLLVDQGEADNFLAEQLRPELLAAACAAASIPLTLRIQPGYDHSYYFISTFMAEHLRWHAARLIQ